MAKPYMPLMMGDKFNEPAWNTEQTYSENFKKIPNSSGVYAFVTINDEVLYVGSAKDLHARYDKHEVKRLLKKIHRRVWFYFHETPEYRLLEITMIKTFKPFFNTRHNG